MFTIVADRDVSILNTLFNQFIPSFKVIKKSTFFYFQLIQFLLPATLKMQMRLFLLTKTDSINFKSVEETTGVALRA